MSRRGWIFLLVGIGVVIAVVIGLLANSQSREEAQYCDSLTQLESSISALTSVDAATLSQGQLQSDISSIQSAWGDVKNNASDISDDNQQAIDSAWDSFESSVKNLTSGGSASDVQSAAENLGKTVQSSIDDYDCSSGSSSSSSS